MPCVKLIALLAILITPATSTPQPIFDLLKFDGSEVTINPTGDECQEPRECVDCETGRICKPSGGKLLQFATVRCSADQNRPYCNPEDGTCTAVAPTNCTAKDFVCPDTDGTYPDPSSCTVYHICVNGFRVTNSCPLNNVYDHSVGECRPKRSSRCRVMDCTDKDGEAVVHPADDRIWGICVNDRAYILGRCRDYQRYDVEERRCVRVCRAAGKQPHDTKCQLYVLCASTSPGKYTAAVQSCPCNQGFDETVNECSSNAKCLIATTPWCRTPRSAGDEDSDSGESGSEESGSGESGNEENTNDDSDSGSNGQNNDGDPGGADAVISPFIINNSGSGNSNNNVSNGNDKTNGNIVNGNGNGGNNASGNVQAGERHPVIVPLIINNSGSNNDGNSVSNGDDKVNGNIVNGNENGGNNASGNVQAGERHPVIVPLIINNSGSNNNDNSVSNGNDDVNGNLVNGNSNGENSHSGNINQGEHRPQLSPLIINNAGNGNNNNNVSNGNDDVNGNLVNGNSNGGNSNSGNVNDAGERPQIVPLIINNSGSNNNANDVSNGNDDVNGNLVNGNSNGDNSNSGNVDKKSVPPQLSTLIINNSGSGNNNNNISNGNDDVNGNLVNGNSNGGNSDSGNVHKKREAPQIAPLIVNNSGNSNKNNSVQNGSDKVNGNAVNGNNNGGNENSGNVGSSSNSEGGESEGDENNDVELVSSTAAPEDPEEHHRNFILKWIDRIIEWFRSLFRPRS